MNVMRLAEVRYYGANPFHVPVLYLPGPFLYSRGFMKVGVASGDIVGEHVWTPYSPEWFSAEPRPILWNLAFIMGTPNPLYGEQHTFLGDLENVVQEGWYELGMGARDLPWVPSSEAVFAYVQDASTRDIVSNAQARELASGAGTTEGELGWAAYNAVQELVPTDGGALLKYTDSRWPTSTRIGPNEGGAFVVLGADGAPIVYPHFTDDISLAQLSVILGDAARSMVRRADAYWGEGEFLRVSRLEVETGSSPTPTFVGTMVDEVRTRVSGEKRWLDFERAFDSVFGEGSGEEAWSWAKLLTLAAVGWVSYRAYKALS